MKVSEALEAVSKFYVPDCAGHYARIKSDPWLAAHEDLNDVVQLGDLENSEIAADVFVSKIKCLVDSFSSLGIKSKEITIQDAFAIGNTDRLQKWASNKSTMCYKCESKKELTLMNQEGSPSVVVVCRSCKFGGK